MTIPEKILAFNQGRDPERLRLKYAKMRGDALAFYRGTAHLFYEDLDGLPEAPHAWLCGDLHLENFGSYLADNRLEYFGENDFDEACRGPVTVDLARLIASILLEAHERGFKASEAQDLAERIVKSYARELEAGKARWLEQRTASGIIGELLSGIGYRGRTRFLASRTFLEGRKKRLLVNGRKALPLLDGEEKKLEKFAERELEDFKLLDAARRIAGNGSLGVPRFVLLVREKKGPELLLDLKMALPAAPLRRHRWPQPEWDHEAERVTTVQRMMQAVPTAFLRPVKWQGESWILRELLPQENRVNVAMATDEDFIEFSQTLGQLIAWSALRCSGRLGSATADALSDFGAKKAWRKDLIAFAMHVAERTRSDFEEFRSAEGID